MTKAELRARMAAILASIDAADMVRRSTLSARRFQDTPAWNEAEVVLCFLSMPREIDTAALIEAARKDGRRVAVPRIEGEVIRFVFLPDDAPELPRDRLNIPVPGPHWEPFLPLRGTRALAAVPGLAFDREGNRLGRGKGFYDRFLGEARAALGDGITAIGFCLSEQLVEEVPHTDRDQPLDGVVTERETLLMAPQS